jgi:hypothetical protein
MLGTSQIVTPFNALWSHNVVHSCDQATFTLDCCYDVLQQLLRICISTKASVKFQALHFTTSSNRRKILQLLTYRENMSYL